MGNYYDGITMVWIFGDKSSALGIRSLLFFFLYFMIGCLVYIGIQGPALGHRRTIWGNVHNDVFGIGCLFVLSGSSDAGNKKWHCDLRCPLFIIIIIVR